MRSRVGLWVWCALVAAVSASGQNQIRVWFSDAPGNFRIYQEDRLVRITGAGTFKIDATTTAGTPGIIDAIYTDSGINGTVNVYVHKMNDASQPGVTQLKGVDLTGATEGNLVIVRCSSDVGAISDIKASSISDVFTIGGSILHALDISGAISAPIVVSGFLKADLSCDSLAAFTVSGVGTAPLTHPNISIGSGYGGRMSINQTIATLTIDGDVGPNAAIMFPGYSNLQHLAMAAHEIQGQVSIGNVLGKTDLNQIAFGASLEVGVALGSDSGDYFHIYNNVAGSLTVPYAHTSFAIDGSVSGTVRINQSLDAPDEWPATIGEIAAGGLVEVGSLGGVLNLPEPLSGALHVFGDLPAGSTLKLLQGSTPAATLRCDGNLAGLIEVSGADLRGEVTLDKVAATGQLWCEKNLSAPVQINTDCAGRIETPSTLDYWNSNLKAPLVVNGDFTGHLRIGGRLSHDPNAHDPNVDLRGGSVWIGGDFYDDLGGLDGAVLQFDYPPSLQDWPYFFVYIGGAWAGDAQHCYVRLCQDPACPPVTQNAPDYHLWHGSSCRLDLNNDLMPAVADIDAFIEAAADPYSFAQDYPGLTTMTAQPGGTWVLGPPATWLADVNCSDEVDALDLNDFVRGWNADCYADCDPITPLAPPTDDPNLLGLKLLQNVNTSRWPALLALEEQLSTDPSFDPAFRGYWQSVLNYQMTTQEDRGVFAMGPELVEGYVTLRNADPSYQPHQYSVWTSNDAVLTITPLDETPNVFEHEEPFAVTVNRCSLYPPCELSGSVTIQVDGDRTIEIPVTLTKALASPHIIPWVELSSDDPNEPNFPNDPFRDVIDGLKLWRRVTDTVCITTVTDNGPSYLATIKNAVQAETGRELHIYGVFATYGFLFYNNEMHFDSAAGWAQIAVRADQIRAATGEDVVGFDHENALKCAGCYWDDPNTVDLDVLRDECLPQLSDGVTYFWYLGYNTAVPHLASRELAIAAIAGIAGSVRLVDMTYGNDESYLESVKVEARGWLDDPNGNNPAPTAPLIWFGSFENWPGHYTCYWPFHGHMTDPNNINDCWDIEVPGDPNLPHIMDILRTTDSEYNLIPRQDVFFYPGRSRWIASGAIMANWACHTENWPPQ